MIAAIPFFGAAGLSYVAAGFAVTEIEENTEIAARQALDAQDKGWAEVQANGLQVILSGTAPNEAGRFLAISTLGTVVDAARIIDAMTVTPTADLQAPRFSTEILRNDSGISIIGLVPQSTDRDTLISQIDAIAGAQKVADLLETAAYPAPQGWDDALRFALTALARLPRSKVSVDAGQVSITAIAESPKAKGALEAELTRAVPPGLRLALDIAAPRPVITPFTLRFILDETGGRFDACSAENESSSTRILAAARRAGLEGDGSCVIGMGVPSPNWSAAVVQSLEALTRLGAGKVTFADADITLVAAEGTDQGQFDRVIGELETSLPDVFALHAVLPTPTEDPSAGPTEFVATLSPEGLVQLRGRVPDENTRHLADSFAKAAFGSGSVYTAARVVADLPSDWALRVLAGLQALSMLENGAVVVTPDDITVRGISERQTASAEISQLFTDRLGEAQTYSLDITYREPPLPADVAPDPEICEAAIETVQEGGKIAFEPGSATISATSLDTMNAIAEILKGCGDIRLEIQGHTDSQGRDEMNMDLSQARVQSVLNELRARRVLTASYAARGYGETKPIADNDSEEGREANRRIEFRLIRPAETQEDGPSTLDTIADQAETDAPEAETSEGEETPDEQN